MGKPKKTSDKLTTDEAIRRLFGKKGARILKQLAHELDEEKKPKKRRKNDDQ